MWLLDGARVVPPHFDGQHVVLVGSDGGCAGGWLVTSEVTAALAITSAVAWLLASTVAAAAARPQRPHPVPAVAAARRGHRSAVHADAGAGGRGAKPTPTSAELRKRGRCRWDCLSKKDRESKGQKREQPSRATEAESGPFSCVTRQLCIERAQQVV